MPGNTSTDPLFIEKLASNEVFPVAFNIQVGAGWVCAPTSMSRQQVQDAIVARFRQMDKEPGGTPEIDKSDTFRVVRIDDDDPTLCSPGACAHSNAASPIPRRHWKFVPTMVLHLMTMFGELDPDIQDIDPLTETGSGGMTLATFTNLVKINYGEPGLNAIETGCVTEADCAKGYDHALSMILPALEEELIANDELPEYEAVKAASTKKDDE